MRQIVADVFLWLGVVLSLISCVGLLVARSVFDRLHFLGPITLGGVCVAVAVVVHNSFSLVGDQAVLVAVLVMVCSPVLTHAAARAARIMLRGDWRIQPSEAIEIEEP
jgi:multisubunit Na+/H+ antiporter MnhG subunit